MSHPDDLLPWPGSGGAGTLTCPLESPLQRCFLLSASVESLSKDRINSVTVQTKFYLFPGLKLYFVEADSMILLKHWPLGKIIKHNSHLFLNTQEREQVIYSILLDLMVFFLAVSVSTNLANDPENRIHGLALW